MAQNNDLSYLKSRAQALYDKDQGVYNKVV
jgi:hypothetical protein